MAATLTTWRIRTFVGTGEPGFGGDGGVAVQAQLNEPKGVTIDQHGHVYVADSENQVIRKIDRVTGRISTVAGTPFIEQTPAIAPPEPPAALDQEDPFAENGDGPGTRAYTQQADLSGTVRYWTQGPSVSTRYGGDGGLAVRAQLNFPTAVVVDRAGNLYIADTMNHRVRRVDALTGVITTLAGTGQARFLGDGGPADQAALNEPSALVLSDDDTRLYIADQSNHRVRMIDLRAGVIQTVAGTGAATYDGDGKPGIDTALSGPSGLAFAGDQLYIADTFNGRVRGLHLETGLISTVAGDGGTYRYESVLDASSASLSRPTGIAVNHQGRLFLTDSDNHLIREWDQESGMAVCVAGKGIPCYSGDGGLAREAGVCYPFGIVADRDGTLLVADTFNHRIRVLRLE
jgi:DNA-binding beta-propeller fold protein YncE